MTASEAATLYENLVAATQRDLNLYTATLPEIYHQPETSSPFTYTVTPTEEDRQPSNATLADQFRGTFDKLFSSRRPVNSVHIPLKPVRADYSRYDLSKDKLEREYKDEMKEYERAIKEHEKMEQQLWDEQTITQQTFWGTPLYRFADSFMPESPDRFI